MFWRWLAVVLASMASIFGVLMRPACAVEEAPASGVCGDLCPIAEGDCLCECCDSGSDGPRLLGLLPSDHCFDRFISPLSNPFFFEDPRSLTEVRGIFIDNKVPSTLGGFDVNVFAGQFRGRVTDRLSLIAPRLGGVDTQPSNPNAPSGLLSSPVGFKYNLVRDVDSQFLVSTGMTYFFTGSASAYSSFPSRDLHVFVTAGKEIFDWGHWLSATGFRIPTNNNIGTQLWYWSNQWDYEVADHWYGLVGLNWYHWMKSSTLGFPSQATGLDLINLPVTTPGLHDLVTGLVGGKWKPSGNMELGAGYEFPLTNSTDILRSRLYVDLIFRY